MFKRLYGVLSFWQLLQYSDTMITEVRGNLHNGNRRNLLENKDSHKTRPVVF